MRKNRKKKQECILVGCVPPAAVAVCWGSASVHAGIPPPGVCLETPPGQTQLPSPRVWAWRPARHAGIPPPPQRPAWHAGIPPAMHAGIPPPPFPVNRILYTRFRKYYLAPTSLLAVNICFILLKGDGRQMANPVSICLQHLGL